MKRVFIAVLLALIAGAPARAYDAQAVSRCNNAVTTGHSVLWASGASCVSDGGTPVTSVATRTGAVTLSASDIIAGTFPTARVPTGTSVADPGTGTLEFVLPVQTAITGSSNSFATSDTRKFWRWSNSGGAMTGTLPAGSGTAGFIALWNTDSTATATYSVTGGGWIGSSGNTSWAQVAGRRTTLIPDGSGNWVYWSNDNQAAFKGANTDITSLSGLTTPLSVGQGGTNATTAAGARTSLGAAASGANSDITSLAGLTAAVSFSPTVSFQTPGDLSVSYATQAGYYFQVGKIVWIYINVTFTPTFTTASGVLQIPSPVTGNSSVQSGMTVQQFTTLTYPGSGTSLNAFLKTPGTNFQVQSTHSAGGNANVQASSLSSGTAYTIIFSGAFLAS